MIAWCFRLCSHLHDGIRAALLQRFSVEGGADAVQILVLQVY
jgi:hypothetical protein